LLAQEVSPKGEEKKKLCCAHGGGEKTHAVTPMKIRKTKKGDRMERHQHRGEAESRGLDRRGWSKGGGPEGEPSPANLSTFGLNGGT